MKLDRKSIIQILATIWLLPLTLNGTIIIESGAPGKNIQSAIDGLPPQRDYLATVKLVGRFELAQPLVLPNFTRLDLTEASLKLTDGSVAALITNADHEAGNDHIEIIGGKLKGPGQEGDALGIFLVRAQNSRISGTSVTEFPQDGIRLSGHGRHSRKLFVDSVTCTNNGNSGLNLMWAVREVQVSNVLLEGNLIGLRSDHSEGSYVNVNANANRQWGIYIRNVFGNHYTNLTACRNGSAGINVLGMVSSGGTSWRAHNNGQQDATTPADLVFDDKADLSYGRSASSIISGISAGHYPQYGGSTKLDYAVYFQGEGADSNFKSLLLIGLMAGETKSGTLRHPPGAVGIQLVACETDKVGH